MTSLLSRLKSAALARPWVTAALALALSWLVINPWGNYSLNDDWTYAHLAKRIAATGEMKIDVPIAPNAVGQALLGAAVVRVLGFHHFWLRLLTLAIAILGLWAVDRIVATATKDKAVRLASLLLLAFNPIYYYSTASFMNELYGWVPPLLGAVLWLWDRDRLEKAATGRVFTSWVPAVAGLIIGLGFYTRQFGVLIFPALVGATALSLSLGRQWQRLRQAMLPLGLGAVACGLAAWSYFPWARATGNFRPEFAVRIHNLGHFEGNTWLMQSGSVLMYVTAFFLPLLVLFSWKGAWRWLALSAGLVTLALTARYRFQIHAPSDFWIGPNWSHRIFPWVVNVIWNAGLGPITLDDGFFYDAPKASWPREVWQGIELVLVAGTALWALALGPWLKQVKASAGVAHEAPLFGWLLTLGCVVAIIQAHQGEVVDRYYLPHIFGLAIALPAMLATRLAAQPAGRVRVGLGLALGLALATFSVFGAHDQFQWNDARWEMIGQAMSRGGTRTTVQGGYELNCWNRHEGLTNQELACEGGCQCMYNGFCCIDDRWRIGTSVAPGYHVVAQAKPSWWLANGPPVVLTTRL